MIFFVDHFQTNFVCWADACIFSPFALSEANSRLHRQVTVRLSIPRLLKRSARLSLVLYKYLCLTGTHCLLTGVSKANSRLRRQGTVRLPIPRLLNRSARQSLVLYKYLCLAGTHCLLTGVSKASSRLRHRVTVRLSIPRLLNRSARRSLVFYKYSLSGWHSLSSHRSEQSELSTQLWGTVRVVDSQASQ